MRIVSIHSFSLLLSSFVEFSAPFLITFTAKSRLQVTDRINLRSPKQYYSTQKKKRKKKKNEDEGSIDKSIIH